VPRSAVAISLPGSEFRDARKHLTEAGFEAIAVKSPADVGKLLAKRSDVNVAILDVEADFDGSMEMYGLLRGRDPNVYILMLVPPRSLGRIGLNRGVDPHDEYFTRPYSAESLRWRIEAMLIRAEQPAAGKPVSGLVQGGNGPFPALSAETQALADAELGEGSPIPDSAESGTITPGGGSHAAAAGGTRRTKPHFHGNVAIVFNPKGGVGKTTIAINLGSALQIRRGKRVLIVDCDTITGHVASSLGLERPRTLAHAWRDDIGTGERAYERVEEIATLHSSGLSVLVMSESPLHTEVLEPKRVADAICAARHSYDWLILDMHPDYGPLNQALFEQADRIIVPVTPDIPCIRAAIQFREVATELNLRDRMSVVVNRANSGVPTDDLVRVVDLPVLARIRSAGLLFVRAADEGRSAVERFPTSKVVSDLDAMAGRLLEGIAAGGRKPPFASRRRIAGSVKGLLGRRAAKAAGGPEAGPR
jgi:MinD-like ATPase involved in chromosome partitioning or flagellar assembly